MYAGGRGVGRDNAEAVRWYRMAAERGDVGGQFNLGAMYNEGRGVPQDFVQAHKWYNLAAANITDEGTRELAASFRDRVARKMTPEPDCRGAETGS